jgi:hypothetical protein
MHFQDNGKVRFRVTAALTIAYGLVTTALPCLLQQCRQFHIGIADAIRKASAGRKNDVPATKPREEPHVSHTKAARQAGYVPGQPPATPAELTLKMNSSDQVRMARCTPCIADVARQFMPVARLLQMKSVTPQRPMANNMIMQQLGMAIARLWPHARMNADAQRLTGCRSRSRSPASVQDTAPSTCRGRDPCDPCGTCPGTHPIMLCAITYPLSPFLAVVCPCWMH